MTSHVGNDGQIKVNSNVVAEVVSWSISESVEIRDDTRIHDTWDKHRALLKSWVCSVSCYWDETDTTGQEVMTIGTEVAIELIPDTEVDARFNGYATITSIERSGANDSIVTANISLQGKGLATRI